MSDMKISSTDVDFEAGADFEVIVNKVVELAGDLPDASQANNFEVDADGSPVYNPARATTIRITRDEKANIIACTTFQIPNLDELLASTKGRAWVEKVVAAGAGRKIAHPINAFAKSDKSQPADLPSTVDDFITVAERVSSSGVKRHPRALWDKYRKAIMSKLQDMFEERGAKLVITYKDLEQAFAHESYRAAQTPQLSAKLIEHLLDQLIGLEPITYSPRNSDNVLTDDGALFRAWKAERNITVQSDEVEIDLDALDF